MTLRAPAPLSAAHDLTGFACGDPSLDDWLRRRARSNQNAGSSRTFVICEGERVVGYHALAAGSVNVEQAPGRFRRNMPDPIPVAILARFAIDRNWQGRGLGRALFRDALMRVMHAADTIGVRGLLVHAISPQAQAFYIGLGLSPSPIDPNTLMVTLADARNALAD